MIGELKYYLRTNTNIDEVQLEKIGKCFKFRKIKRDTLLLSEGEVCKALYFVNTGCLRTYYLTPQGKEKTRYIAFEGSVVTSISSFIAQQPSFEFVEALEDSDLYSINHQDFYQLVSDIPEWERFYTQFLESAYRYQNRKIETLMTLSAKQRYDKILNEKPHYVSRLSNKNLASYLNIREETLSRLKSK